ncbi:hypothetical protein ACFU44_13925 [Nocardia rhizosphaerihabitans]|uniref:hypothetical protein n=1 Tax=Nocardia rhizosphaerihabitans TaxID=1691570 RepID=UPI00366AFA09
MKFIEYLHTIPKPETMPDRDLDEIGVSLSALSQDINEIYFQYADESMRRGRGIPEYVEEENTTSPEQPDTKL